MIVFNDSMHCILLLRIEFFRSSGLAKSPYILAKIWDFFKNAVLRPCENISNKELDRIKASIKALLELIKLFMGVGVQINL